MTDPAKLEQESEETREAILKKANSLAPAYSKGAYQFIGSEEAAKDAGYNMPQMIFWNINARGGKPVEYNEKGVALVSGYSPAIVKMVLGGTLASPEQIMLDAIDKDRYRV